MSEPDKELQAVEIEVLDDENPLVGDLHICSVRDFSLFFPIIFCFVVIAIGAMLPSKYEVHPSSSEIPKNTDPLRIETAVSDIVTHHGFISLLLRFEGCEYDMFSTDVSVTLSFYSGGELVNTYTADSTHVFDARGESRASNYLCLFKSTYISYDRIRAQVVVPRKPEAAKYTIAWVHGHAHSLLFMYSARLALFIASIPQIVMAVRSWLSNDQASLCYERLITYGLLFVLVTCFNPIVATWSVFPISVMDVIERLAFYLIVAGIIVHSLSVFGHMILDSGGNKNGVILPHIFGVLVFLYFTLQMARTELGRPNQLFPAIGIPADTDLGALIVLAAYGVCFIWYTVKAGTSPFQYKRNRIISYAILIVAMYLSCAVYAILGLWENPILESSAYYVWPMVACYLYTWIMLYLHSETEERDVFTYQARYNDDDNNIGAETL